MNAFIANDLEAADLLARSGTMTARHAQLVILAHRVRC
jgi:hypothetical protein